MIKRPEQIKIDFSGELSETRVRATEQFVKQLSTDDVLLGSHVKNAYKALEKVNGVLLPYPVGKELLLNFWETRGWKREQFDTELLEKYADSLHDLILKKMIEIGRRKREDLIGLHSGELPEEPESLKEEYKNRRNGSKKRKRNIPRTDTGRYIDNRMLASGEKPDDD